MLGACTKCSFFLPVCACVLSGCTVAGPSKPPAPGTGGHGGGTKLLPVILTCIPYTLAAISSYCIAHSSQKKKELYIHTAVPAFIGGGRLSCFVAGMCDASRRGVCQLSAVGMCMNTAHWGPLNHKSQPASVTS